MSTTLEARFENGILFAAVSGTYSNESAKARFGEILKEVAKYGTNKVLIDTTKIKNITTSKLNAFDYGKFAASETLEYMKKGNKQIKFAYFYNPKDEDVLKFGETVAQNRGMTAKAFTDLKEATEWLSNY